MVSNNIPTNKLRTLGSIETRMALFHQNLNGSTQGTQTIDFEAEIASKLFYEAVAALYQKYVPLQSTIKRAEQQYAFYKDAKLSDIDVNYIEVSTTKERDNLVRLALDNEIKATQGLWRISLVTNKTLNTHTLILSAHHAIIDANGMHHIAQSFFDFVASRLSGHSLFDETTIAFPLAVDDLMQPSKTTPPADQTMPRPFDESCPIANRKTHWQDIKLNQSYMDRLNKNLESDNLKFHSIVTAAMCIALQKTQFLPAPFPFGTAVTLRFLQDANPANSNPLGCYMSIASNLIDGVEQDVAKLAAKYDRALMHKIMTTCLTKTEIDINQIDAGTKNIASQATFSQGVGITNMGDINIQSPHECIALTDYAMLANRVAGNFSIVTHCYSFNDVQTISLVYPNPLLSEDWAKKITAEMKNLLNDYCDKTEQPQTQKSKAMEPA